MKNIIKKTSVILAILLGIGVTSTSYYYYNNYMKNKTRSSGSTDTHTTPNPTAAMREYIDWQIKPQDTLYAFANGNWLNHTSIPNDKSIYSTFHILSDQNDIKIGQLIDLLRQEYKTQPTFNTANILNMYDSFLAQDTREALQLKPLQKEIAQIDSISDLSSLLATMAQLHRIGVTIPFSLSVNQDMKEATQYILGIYQSGLGLPDKDYYGSSNANFAQIQKNYIEHIKNMLTLAAIPNPEKQAQIIFNIEKKLAQIHWSRVECRDYDKLYNKVEVQNLSSLTPHIEWTNYLKAFHVPSSAAQAHASILVYQPSTLMGIDRLLTQIPIEDWKSYLRWHLLSDFAPYLNKSFVDENFKFYGAQLSGLAQNTPLEKRAINLVNGTLGEALGQVYVKHYFSAQSKKQIDILVKNLKQAFKLNLEHNTWMSEQTKQAALLKLSKMTTKIGYPSKWKTYERLQIKNNTLIQNIINSNIYEFNRELKKLNKPVDRTEWQILPQTINAYYSPNMNEIVFPAAILQAPLFDSHASDAQNYGAIGAVIGHEISHAFDDQGRKFDSQGNLKDWWTPQDAQNFQHYAQALVKQYGQYEPIKGIHLNGELTLGENIADISGLSVSYHAFQIAQASHVHSNNKNIGKNETPTSLPLSPSNKPLTDNQLFFISWAQTWKNKIREQELQQRLITDPHSPGAYRADGVVKNIDAFYQAFNVHPTDKMYLAPNERVNLWSFLDKQNL